MSTTTLNRWGNGQGVLIPKGACEKIGLRIGDKVSVEALRDSLVIRPENPRHRRTRKLSAAEVFDGWDGQYEPPSDYPTVGREIDWGGPVGGEMW